MAGMVPCRPCAGTGEYPPTGGDVCSWCEGAGEVQVNECPECDGKGWYADHAPGCFGGGACEFLCPVQTQCSLCRGVGVVPERVVQD